MALALFSLVNQINTLSQFLNCLKKAPFLFVAVTLKCFIFGLLFFGVFFQCTYRLLTVLCILALKLWQMLMLAFVLKRLRQCLCKELLLLLISRLSFMNAES